MIFLVSLALRELKPVAAKPLYHKESQNGNLSSLVEFLKSVGMEIGRSSLELN